MTHPTPEAVAGMIVMLREHKVISSASVSERIADLLAALSAERDEIAKENRHNGKYCLIYLEQAERLESYLAAARATIAEKDAEIARLNATVYVPGRWQCKKCGFCLMQRTFRASDGAVGVRDEPGEHCPNDGSPLWRVTEREAGNELVDRAEEYLKRAIDAEATIAERDAEIATERSMRDKASQEAADLFDVLTKLIRRIDSEATWLYPVEGLLAGERGLESLRATITEKEDGRVKYLTECNKLSVEADQLRATIARLTRDLDELEKVGRGRREELEDDVASLTREKAEAVEAERKAIIDLIEFKAYPFWSVLGDLIRTRAKGTET